MLRRPHRAALYVLASQVCFFAMLAVCIPLAPRAIRHHLGVSYFGTNPTTVPAYVIGLLLTGYFLVKAAHALPQHAAPFRTLSEILLILAILVVGVCLTPYSVDAVFDWAHVTASMVLFIVELGLAIWLVVGPCRGTRAAGLLAFQVGGALIAFLSELRIVHHMLLGETLTQLAFGALLVRCLWRMTSPHPGRSIPHTGG